MGDSLRRRDGGAVHGAYVVLLAQGKLHSDDPVPAFGGANDPFDFGTADLPDARQECPLIRMRMALFIEKDAVATIPRPFLQRQGDEVAEAAVRQRVLIGEEPVIRTQADIRATLHRLGQNVRAEIAGQPGRNGFLEKQPQVSAIAGARAFDGRRKIPIVGRYPQRRPHLRARFPYRNRRRGNGRFRPAASGRRP